MRLWTSIFLCTFLAAGCNSGSRDDPNKSTAAAATSTSGSTTGGSTTPTIAVAPVVSQQAQAKLAPDVVSLVVGLSAAGAPIEVSALTVKASGTVDESAELGELKVVGDDNKNGQIEPGEPVLATLARAFTADDGSTTVTLNTPITIAPNASLQLIVAVDASAIGASGVARIGKTVELSVVAATDITATSGGQPVTPGGNFPISGNPVTLFLNDHLLISEVVPSTAAEYVEIFNPTSQTIDLSKYYLTEANDATNGVEAYFNLPSGRDVGPENTFSDFIVRFPAGSTIAPGATITIATDGAEFETAYGQAADYCVRDASGGSVQMLTPDTSTPPQWSATPSQGQLFDTGEMLVLFYWDEQDDLVKDVDYLFFGSPSSFNTQMDKSGITVDGPDADTTASPYFPETPINQQAVAAVGSAPNHAIQRIDFAETGETTSGGNGITGHDETSEPVDTTFQNGPPTPGTP